MRKTLVYDLPTRLFHWLFSGLFLVSFIIAKTVDDESLTFSYHMLSGLLLGGLVIWRLIWGVIGSEHSRFSGFNLHPSDLKDYFLGILSGSQKRWSGHNPASGWAAIALFTLALGLAVTGYLMTTGQKEAFEDLHEFFANTFVIVTIMHVAGVILHSLRHQDSIALSMIDGKKELPNSISISSTRPFGAIFLMALVVSMGLYLFKNFDSSTQTLKIFGQTLQLGENEQEKNEQSKENGPEKNKNESDDSDDD